MSSSSNSEETSLSLAKALLAMVGMPLLSLAAGIAIGGIALVIGAFLIANPFVGLSGLAIFLKAKSDGASTEDAMAESGFSTLVKPDSLEKLWKTIRDILS